MKSIKHMLSTAAFTITPFSSVSRRPVIQLSINQHRQATSSFTERQMYSSHNFKSSYIPCNPLIHINNNNTKSGKHQQKHHHNHLIISMSTSTSTPSIQSPNSKLTLLYDGECPLCMREVNMLRRRSDARNGILTFIDIADEEQFNEDTYGVDYATAMGTIHAVRNDNTLITGVQVFREAYEAVGLGWIYIITKAPGMLWLANKVYDVWADRRLQFTGRDTLEAIIRSREEKRSCR